MEANSLIAGFRRRERNDYLEDLGYWQGDLLLAYQ